MAATDTFKIFQPDSEKLKNIDICAQNQMYLHKKTDSPEVFDIIGNNVLNKSSCDCLNTCSKDKYSVDMNMNEAVTQSKIQRFYHGKNVMITGATGFLGKILMEKLLRRCPGLDSIYLLVRQKRGKDVHTRIEEIFTDPVFDRLKEELPKFRHKIVVVNADCDSAGFGLALSDRQMLIEKVNVIFHSAATVKFDEHLRAALVTNVRAPLHLLRLARDMKGLHALMHISTAYSNSHLPSVEERFYPCETSCDQLHEMISKLSDTEIDDMLPTILGPWPNTYTFTKALAEKELRVNVGTMPLGIFRPAVVTSTAKEPLKGWIDNMYGPTGVSVGSATGMLRTLHCGKEVTADIVPVDYVVNALIAAAVSVHNAHQQSPPPLEPPIFNYVSSVENRITWGDFLAMNLARADTHPFSNAIWYISVKLTPSVFMNNFYILFLHLIPAALIDGLTVCVGRKPKMLKTYRKIHKFSSVISYFCTRDIQFCNRRTRQLWDETSEIDRKLFQFSIATVDWNEYFDGYLAGIRRYLFKESDDSLPRARIKWRRLYYLHQLVKYLFYFLVIYVLWSVLRLLFFK